MFLFMPSDYLPSLPIVSHPIESQVFLCFGVSSIWYFLVHSISCYVSYLVLYPIPSHPIIFFRLFQDPEKAMREAFLSVDSEFLEMAGEKDWYSGTTVLVALMRGRSVQPSFSRLFFCSFDSFFLAGCFEKKKTCALCNC